MLYYLCFSPFDRNRTPSAIGECDWEALSRPISRPHTGRRSQLPRSKPPRIVIFFSLTKARLPDPTPTPSNTPKRTLNGPERGLKGKNKITNPGSLSTLLWCADVSKALFRTSANQKRDGGHDAQPHPQPYLDYEQTAGAPEAVMISSQFLEQQKAVGWRTPSLRSVCSLHLRLYFHT